MPWRPTSSSSLSRANAMLQPNSTSSSFHLTPFFILPLLAILFTFVFLLAFSPDPGLLPRPIGRDYRPTLEEVLGGAAMLDGTVILTTLNAAWAGEGSALDLFLESFRIGERTRGLLDHLVIVALDRGAHARCVAVHRHCLAVEEATDGVDFSGEKDFMTEGYVRMMWWRIGFLREVLEKGFHFIFTDADVLWFRNPLPYFTADADFQIACDQFVGISRDLHNKPNGGFKYVKSNNRTVEFYKFWYSSRLKYPGYNDQDVLNLIKRDPYLVEIGLQIRFLNTAYFGGLCEPSNDFSKVCTMHVNCCIGLQRKLHDLRVMLEDWRRFMYLPPGMKDSGFTSWSVPQMCSLAPLAPSNSSVS